jgi:divalent metal cation (Fe/Co/Zn/Cd) transporter
VLGILLAGVSLVVMPLVAWGKLHAAAAMHSATLRAEAKETLACSYLSFTLLLGLVANAMLGWWWADPDSTGFSGKYQAIDIVEVIFR